MGKIVQKPRGHDGKQLCGVITEIKVKQTKKSSTKLLPDSDAYMHFNMTYFESN